MDTAEIIAVDVVNWVCFREDMVEDSSISMYSSTMQQLVLKGLETFELAFRELIPVVNRTNAASIFTKTLRKMLRGKAFHWGNIVSVYILGATIARRLAENGDDVHGFTTNTFMPAVHRHISPRVSRIGGWDAFHRFFVQRCDEQTLDVHVAEQPSRFIVQLIVLGMGLLAAAAVTLHR